MPTHLTDVIEQSYAADRAFQAALNAAGFKSRWHWHIASGSPQSVVVAYHAKLAADQAMHTAFAEARRA